MSGGAFAGEAARLAGFAGAVLGWSPAQFWDATPAELAAVVGALAGDVPVPADAGLLARLRAMHPDGDRPMDEEIERLVIAVRADTAGFARDVATMKGELGGGLGEGAGRAGRLIEASLLRAVRTGKLGFDDLKASALRVLDEIAAASLRGVIGRTLPGGGLGTIFAGLIGAPGRATGGPVAPGRAYAVGERGPELFVPTTSGRIETGAPGGSAREVRVAITINAAAGAAPAMLAQSSRQVARAVRAALSE